MRTKYWIVGGEYADTSFDRLLDGTAEIKGPFASRETALDESWSCPSSPPELW